MSDDLEERIAAIYRERSVMDLTKAREIIEMVKQDAVEAVDDADVISNPKARRNAIKAINQL